MWNNVIRIIIFTKLLHGNLVGNKVQARKATNECLKKYEHNRALLALNVKLSLEIGDVSIVLSVPPSER